MGVWEVKNEGMCRTDILDMPLLENRTIRDGFRRREPAFNSKTALCFILH